jgi:carbon storage regulator
MLILSRKVGQSIIINDDIEIVVTEVRGDNVRLGIAAPKTVPVRRKEVLEQVRRQNVEAAMAPDDLSALENLPPPPAAVPE